MIHKIFKTLLRQIGDTGGWEFAEFWAINQEYRVLQFCPVCWNVNHGDDMGFGSAGPLLIIGAGTMSSSW